MPRYQPTPEDRAWWFRRLGYYGLQVLLFLAIIYRVGPNMFLFHSPFSPSAASYVRYTNDYVQIIAALKAYNRDYGVLVEICELPKEYQPPHSEQYWGDEIMFTTSITIPHGREVFEYEFSPGKEGWYIHSPRYDGPLPAPIVDAAPKPTTQPATPPAAPSSSNLPTGVP